MITMSDAVTQVARQANVVASGGVPDGHVAADIRAAVQGVIDSLPLFHNGPWADVLLTSSDAYEAKDGERIAVQGFDPVITLPTTYEDDCGDTKIMRDLSRVQVIGDGIYVYSSVLGAWNKTDELEPGDPFPFAQNDYLGIVAQTVVEIAHLYSDTPAPPAIVRRAEQSVASFRGRFWRTIYVREPDGSAYSDYAA